MTLKPPGGLPPDGVGDEPTTEMAEMSAPRFITEPARLSPRSQFGLADLASEMSLAMTARPARTLLTALGTILGVAALVATLGLAKTAGNQIVSRVNELEASEVSVVPEDNSGFLGNRGPQRSAIPWDAEDRLERLNGVVAAGSKSPVDVGDRLARSVPVIDPSGQTEFQIPVIAASPGLFRVARSTLFTGRYFDDGHAERGERVAVLGPAAAKRLNLTRVDNQPVVFVGDESFTVIGLIVDTVREPDLLNAIIIPEEVARDRFGLEGVAEVVIEVELGAAELIAEQAPLSLAPNNSEELDVRAPPPPGRLREGVEGDVNSLFLILGGVSLLVGAIGIANVTLVAVLERTGEIGLRRALGATRRHIAIQFLSESVALGALAGLLGTSLGILTVVVVSANEQWSPVLDPWLPFAAPILGAVIGLIAGTYPAWKASSTEPIAALRGTA